MYVPASFRPGIFKEASELGAGEVSAWEDGNLIRFWKGQPQPIGGWVQQTSTNAVRGVPRNITDWTSNSAKTYAAVGTNSKVYIYDSGTYYDITPIGSSGSLGNNPFTATSGSSLVDIVDTAHGLTVDTYVRFADSDVDKGIDMDFNISDAPNTEFIVTTVTDADNYTVETGQTASGTGAFGGTDPPTFEYDINAGPADAIPGLGWGADSWSDGGWGVAGTTPNSLLAPRTWAMPTWGEDLIFNPRGGGLYLWDTSGGVATRATAALTGSPATNQFILVSPHTRYLLSFGAHDGAADDPLLIRWPSQNDYTDWTPTETNTAGDQLIDQGSMLMSAIITANGDIGIFTDTAMYIMQFVDQPFIWKASLVGTNAGIISPGAAATWADNIWYMGEDNFFVYDGRVRILQCDVESHVFDDLNLDQKDKFHATTNTEFQEVTFFYVSAAATEIDRYASFNWRNNTWNIGILDRTAWHDHSVLFRQPYAYDAAGTLYAHEDPTNPPSGVFLESGAIQISQGNEMMYTDRIIPDFERNTGTVNVTIKVRDYPAADERTKGPYPMTSSTEKVDFRIRGRQTRIRLDSDAADWRLSSIRLNARSDGRR